MIKVQRPENVRMQAFLAANGIQAVPRWETAGSMKHVWRLYAKGVPWTEQLARRLTELGFLGWDGEPLGRFSGNGGMFSVFVRGHEELVNGEPETMKQNVKADVAPAQCGQHTLGKWKVLERYTDRQAVPIGVEIASSGGLAHSVFAEAHGSNCEANAAFIVRAANAHDQLVSALQDMLRDCTCPLGGDKADRWHATCEAARAALAQAQKSA